MQLGHVIESAIAGARTRRGLADRTDNELLQAIVDQLVALRREQGHIRFALGALLGLVILFELAYFWA